MKIQRITQNHPRQHFGAGVTKLYTDFDGTYIPDRFSHDSVCNSNPPVNKGDFKSYFDKIWKLFGALKGNGEESKFNFVVTTGRNIAETNYYLDKLRSQDLWVPLPEKLVTCNGQDEYYLNVKNEEEFFRGDKPAFVKENVNQEKREYYKAQGWDYAKIKEQLKEILSKRQYEKKVKFQDREIDLHSAMFEQLSVCKRSPEELLNEIETKHLDEAAIRKLLDDTSTKEVLQKDKPLHDWYMGELAHILYEQTTRRHEVIDNVPTTRSCKEYGTELSLQTALAKLGLQKESDYVAFSDDGELGIRIAVSKNYQDNIEFFISNKKNLPTFKDLIKGHYEVTKLKKGSFAGREFEIRPFGMGKLNDTQKIVDEIIKNKTNDLLIVAGDGSNDVEMLSLANYTYNSIYPSSQGHADRILNLPLISIFVDTRSDVERADNASAISKMIRYSEQYNFDGNIRFIHVDANDPQKPHTMEEAMKLAIASYAKRNSEFKKNLAPEIQKMTEDYKITYPIDEEMSKNISSQFSPEIYEQKFVSGSITKLNTGINKLYSIENLCGVENLEEELLDTSSELPDNQRTLAFNILGSMLLTYKTLENKVGKEKASLAINKYLEDSQTEIEARKKDLVETTSDIWKKKYGKMLKELKCKREKFIYWVKEGNLLNIPQDIPAFIQKCKESRQAIEEKKGGTKGTSSTNESNVEIKTDVTQNGSSQTNTHKINEGKKHIKIDEGGQKIDNKGKISWRIKKEKIAEIMESLKKYVFSKAGLTVIATLFTAITVCAVTRCRNQHIAKSQNNIENVVNNHKVNY